jgi:hypothetical protein
VRFTPLNADSSRRESRETLRATTETGTYYVAPWRGGFSAAFQPDTERAPLVFLGDHTATDSAVAACERHHASRWAIVSDPDTGKAYPEQPEQTLYS